MARTVFDPKEEYLGNGLLADYTFDFKIESLDQLLIVEVDDTGVETQRVRGTDTSYLSSVDFDPNDGGGTIHLTANLTDQYRLVLLLANDDPTQPFEFKNKFSFTLERIEAALDFIVGALQRVAYFGQRSVKLHDVDDVGDFDPVLPPGMQNAFGLIPGTKVDGTGWDDVANWTPVTDLLAAVSAAGAAAISEANAAASALAADASATGAAASAVSAAASASSIVGDVALANAAAAAAVAAQIAAGISEGNAAASAASASTDAGTATSAANSAGVSAANAAVSQASAGLSATNAAASAAAALVSEFNAAASATQAAIFAAGGGITNTVYLTFADSPRTIVDGDVATLFVCDATGGAISIVLSLISSLTPGPWNIAFKKVDASPNPINFTPSGSDEIDSGAGLSLSVQGEGAILVPDTTASPDNWSALQFGVSSTNPGAVTAAASFTLDNELLAADGAGSRLAKGSGILISDLSTALTDISTLQGDMTTAQSDIGTLQGQMSTAQSDISTLQGQMSTAQTNISTLQGQMTTAQSDISTLQGASHAAVTTGNFGSTPNAKGLTLVGQTINLEPADATHAGAVSVLAQTYGGEKELLDGLALGPQDVASSATINAMSSTKSFVRITGSTATALNGITAPASGKSKFIIIYNAASVDVTINHNSGSASAGNKILTPTLAATTVSAASSVALIYDQSQAAWVFAASAGGSGGGGGGALVWTPGLAGAPTPDQQNGLNIWSFEDAITQTIYTGVRVPTSYTAGKQIKMRVPFYLNELSSTALLTTVATLIRPGTDAVTSTTNQRTSTNAAITLSGATGNRVENAICDLTDTVGAINSVAVSAGDLIIVALHRGTDSAVTVLNALLDSTEVTFNG